MTANVTQTTQQRVAIGCLALAVIFSCALATLAGVILYRTAAGNGDNAPTIATTADPAPANVADAEFDKGVSKTVEGPAIIQWWDGTKAGCGIVKVDTGQTFTWALMGHWWTFTSQSALENDWANSLAQYAADNPQCTTPLPAGTLK